jgi:hypothetical protein
MVLKVVNGFRTAGRDGQEGEGRIFIYKQNSVSVHLKDIYKVV